MKVRYFASEQEAERNYRIVRLSDLRDIWLEYKDLRDVVEVVLPNPAMRRLHELYEKVRDYAKDAGYREDKLWLNDVLTQEYTDIIFSPDLKKDIAAVDAVFANDERIGCVNHVFEFLHDMEMLNEDALDLFYDCNDMQRLCHAFERLKKSNASVSQSEVKFILANHRAAVSIVNCFILFQYHDYTHALIAALIKYFDNYKEVFIKNEKLVYERGPQMGYACGGDYSSGLLAALDRMTLNGVKLGVDDFLFLLNHPESVMSISACFIMLQNSAAMSPAVLRQVFCDSYNENVGKHLADVEPAVIINTSLQVPVLNENYRTGLVSAIWKIHQCPRLLTSTVLLAMMEHPECCDNFVDALVQLIKQAPEIEGLDNYIKHLCRFPERALDLVAIRLALYENNKESEFEFAADAYPAIKITCLRTIFADILREIKPDIPSRAFNLCTRENLSKLIANIRYIEAVNILLLYLYRMRRLVKSDSDSDFDHWHKPKDTYETYLNQKTFDRVMSIAQYANLYDGIDELIDSEKYLPQEILRLLDHPDYAFELISAMKITAAQKLRERRWLVDQLFTHKYLAIEISRAISKEGDYVSIARMTEIIAKVRRENPSPDLEAHPFPYLLSGWENDKNDSNASYSPLLFQRISLGDSPTLTRNQIDNSGEFTSNPMP